MLIGGRAGRANCQYRRTVVASRMNASAALFSVVSA
jgi:hypothetical protein